MTNKEKPICELLLFHSTTKDNLKGIMKEGIKPGMKGGWCDLWIKQLGEDLPKEELEEEKMGIEPYRKECKENIFLSPSFHGLEEEMPEGSETIVVTCLPKEKVFMASRTLPRHIPFEEWEATRNPLEEKFTGQVAVKETIHPKYIVGCLDVEGKKELGTSIGETKFKINKNCD